MQSFATLVLFASVALAAPSLNNNNNATVAVRQTNNPNKPTCGGAGDATLADCQHLYDNWPYWQDATWDATCHSGTTLEYNPACYGNCCIFTTWNTPLCTFLYALMISACSYLICRGGRSHCCWPDPGLQVRGEGHGQRSC